MQVFGCTVLLLITGLFSKSLLYLTHQEKGFETERAAIAEVSLSGKNYGADRPASQRSMVFCRICGQFPAYRPPVW